jgi:demethylmenaquinone methyltransferase/2-methoxy-6-polyprenyl-1,4-benzoquinol methylase
MHWSWKRYAVHALQLKPSHHVLDVCTGTGDLITLIRPLVGESGQVTGLDFSREMLAVAHNRFQGDDRIQLVQGDAMNLPFEANAFDASIISFGLRNVADVKQTLQEMYRCTKSGGMVVNLDTAPIASVPCFSWYFKWIMPRFGEWFAGDKEAYQYLQASTAQFESPESLVSLFQEIGLVEVRSVRFGLGSVACIIGKKV